MKPLPKVKTVKLVTPRPAKMIKATPTEGKISVCATLQPAAAPRNIVAGAPMIKPILKKTACKVRAIVIYLCRFCWAFRVITAIHGRIWEEVLRLKPTLKVEQICTKCGKQSLKGRLLPTTNVTFFLTSKTSFNSRPGLCLTQTMFFRRGSKPHSPPTPIKSKAPFHSFH